MTNLGSRFVGRSKKHIIRMGVSGDLSYGYSVVPKEYPYAVGMSYSSKKMALERARRADKIGFEKAYDYYDKYERNVIRSKYLRPHMAKPYLKEAYGEYAEKLRRRGY